MADWAVYGAAALAVLSAISALAYAVAQGLLAWRSFKRLRQRVFMELDGVVALADTAAAKAEQAADSARLQASLARLRVALARFAVLRQAVDEVGDTVGRVTAVYPRK